MHRSRVDDLPAVRGVLRVVVPDAAAGTGADLAQTGSVGIDAHDLVGNRGRVAVRLEDPLEEDVRTSR